jgi:2'-5' RNA ligase
VLHDERAGLVLPLDRAEALFGDLRRANVHEQTQQVPAHVTLAHPLPPMADLGERIQRLTALFAAEAPFDLTLQGFGRFGSARVLYLDAHPAERLKRLADAAFACCPGAEPEFPEHVFHMTLVQGGSNLDAAEQAIAKRWGDDLPLTERIERAELYVHSPHGWRLKATFPFGG